MGMDVFDLQGSITLDTSDFGKSIKASVDAVKQVTTAVSSSNNAVTAMQAEFEKQTKKIEAATNAEKQFNAELEKANHAFDDVADGASGLSSEAAELTTKLNATTAEFKKSKTETEELRKKLSEVSAASGETSEEAQQLAQQLEKSEKKTQSLESKMHKLETELESTSKSTDKAKNSTSEFDTELEKAEKETEEFGKSVSDTAKKTDKATDSVSEMVSKLATLKTRIEVASSAYAESEKQVEQLRKELDRAAKESGVNAEETRRLANEYEKAEKESNDLRKKVEELERQYDSAEKETNEFERDTEKLGDTANSTKGKLSGLVDFLQKGLIKGIKASVAAIGAAATAIGAYTKSAFSEYSSYEQLVGGVDTLFKESSEKVQKYAANAYKTAGLSANAYMETVTSFSASLLQGLGGDTEKAADLADLAIRDMSDNANKMGTDMGMIMNAYQGFAKQNYTMLDNLKLGYGGTKGEMARLLNEANKLDNTILGEGVEVDEKFEDVSFDSMIRAIHLVQQEIGMTGTTAEEAEGTLEGSTKAMAASWDNLKTAIASGDIGMLETSISALIDGTKTFVGNAAPVIKRIFEDIGTAVQELSPILQTELPKLINALFPTLLSSAVSLVTTLVSSLGDTLPNLLKGLFNGDMLSQLFDSGGTLLTSLLNGLQSIADLIKENLPSFIQTLGNALVSGSKILLESAVTIVTTLADAILNSSDSFFAVISDMIKMLGDFLVDALPVLIPKAFELVYGLIEALASSDIFGQLMLVITPILTALADGLLKAAPIVYDKLPKIIENIFNTITTHMNEHGDEWVEQIETLVTTLVDGAIELTPIFLEAIGNIVTSLVAGVGDYIPALIDRIKSFFGIESFTESGNNIINGISNALSNGVEIVKEKAKAIFDGVIEWIEQLPERVGYFFTYTLGTIIQWAIDAPETAKTAASSLYDGIVEWVSQIPDMVKNFLTETLPKVVEWGLDLREKGLSAAKDLVNAIITKVQELPDKMLEIGGNIVTGLWNGVTGMKEWLDDRISGFAKGMVKGFEDAFKIKSPSRVMRDQIGVYLAQGIGVGFDDEMPDVVNNMTNALQNGIDSEMKNINGFDINSDYSVTMLDIKGIQDMVNELTKAKNLDINTEYEPPKNQLDDELESIIKARYELENSLPDDITEDLRKTVDVVYNIPNIPNQLETIARVEQMPDISRYESAESIRQAPQSQAEKPIVNNVFNISLALEGVKIASEIDVDEMTDEAVTKLSEKLEYLDVFGARSRGGSATV